MNDLKELYQELILDHSKKPQNFHVLEDATCTVEGFNPLCGDRYTIYLKVSGDLIHDVSFQGSGCAISKSSASLMTQTLKGKTVSEARQWFERFHSIISAAPGSSHQVKDLGKLAVFSGVSEFPARVKCASLAWHTVRAALEGKSNPVSTE
jgi:nitrogen fixation protein NifU and related proteins